MVEPFVPQLSRTVNYGRHTTKRPGRLRSLCPSACGQTPSVWHLRVLGYEPWASLFVGSDLRTVANRGGAGRKKQGLEDLVRTSERTVRRRQAQGCWTTSSTCWRLGARRSRGRHTTAAREPPRHTVEVPRLKGVILGAIATPQGRRSS